MVCFFVRWTARRGEQPISLRNANTNTELSDLRTNWKGPSPVCTLWGDIGLIALNSLSA